MRVTVLLCVGTLLAASGCSWAVIASGKKLYELDTAEQVRAAFGQPVEVGEVDGKPYEEYRTRSKIAEPNKGIYLAMGDVITLGFGELVWFPHECFVAARRSVLGQTLRFTYDEAGHVTAVTHDGEHVSLPWQPWRDASFTPSSPPTPAEVPVNPAQLRRTPPGPDSAPSP